MSSKPLVGINTWFNSMTLPGAGAN